MDELPSDWRTIGSSAPTSPPGSPAPEPSAQAPRRRRASGSPAWGSAAVRWGSAAVRWVPIASAIALALGVGVLAGALTSSGSGGSMVVDKVNADSPGPLSGAAAGVLTGPSTRPGASSAADSAGLMVDVEGGVRRPGLHRLPAGSRVGDAITAAGGFGERADIPAAAGALNLAQPLDDGAKVHVPILGEVATSIPGAVQSAGPSGGGTVLVDLNHASEAELESLPGIGAVTAGKIIDARTAGAFTSVDELLARKVLGSSTLEKIRSLVTVSP